MSGIAFNFPEARASLQIEFVHSRDTPRERRLSLQRNWRNSSETAVVSNLRPFCRCESGDIELLQITVLVFSPVPVCR